MAVSTETIKILRERTGVSVIECKKALEEAGGDMDRALVLLDSRASATAHKKSDRTLGAGTVAAYIHSNGQVGAMILLLCETDFVSKNEEFTSLARDIAMHVTAMRPESINSLMAQSYIRNDSKTISDLLATATQKFGERIDIADMSIFSVR